jgi:hypothetical protein
VWIITSSIPLSLVMAITAHLASSKSHGKSTGYSSWGHLVNPGASMSLHCWTWECTLTFSNYFCSAIELAVDPWIQGIQLRL